MPSHSKETLEHTPSSLPKFDIAPWKVAFPNLSNRKAFFQAAIFSGAMLNFRDVRQKKTQMCEKISEPYES